MTESKTVPGVYAALSRVMEGLSNIPRTGQMSFKTTHYSYLKADDVQERLYPLLVENNLITIPAFDTHNYIRGEGPDRPGVPFVEVHLDLTYVYVPDGSQVTVSSVGECQGSDDKSVNKALTQAIKNAHRATFQFPSGEPEPDDYAPREVPAAPSKVSRQVAQARKPAQTAEEKEAQSQLQKLIADGTLSKEDVNAAYTIHKNKDAATAFRATLAELTK